MYEHGSFPVDDVWPAARAAKALHRQREDGGAVNALRAATDQAIGQDWALDMVGGRLVDGAARCRQHGGEPEQSAAIPVMGMALGMTLAAPAFTLLALVLKGGV